MATTIGRAIWKSPGLSAWCWAAWTIMICPVTLVSAQSYPGKPVKIIVPVAAGGTTDILTRALGQRLTSMWGQQVVIDNRPGGGSNLGFEAAAKSPADGYTLLMAQPAFTINVSLYKSIPYDPLRDFSPVTLVATSANVLVAHPSVPATTLRQLIALAKARPGQINFASSGNGTASHLGGELFKTLAGINMTHIPYKGANPSIIDLEGGHVDLAFVSPVNVLSQLKSGRLKVFAISSAKRSPLLPNVPTFAEAGVPGFEVTVWFGIVTPSGTPAEVINRLHGDIVKVLGNAQIRELLSPLGFDAVGNTPEEFGALLRAEITQWAKVVKASNAKAD